jgi:hypothetical protein
MLEFIFTYFRVTDITKKEKTKSRPQALNTVEMLRVASSGLGIYKVNIFQSQSFISLTIRKIGRDIVLTLVSASLSKFG